MVIRQFKKWEIVKIYNFTFLSKKPSSIITCGQTFLNQANVINTAEKHKVMNRHFSELVLTIIINYSYVDLDTSKFGPKTKITLS